MVIDQVRRARWPEPFQSFTILSKNGESHSVLNPEHIAINPGPMS